MFDAFENATNSKEDDIKIDINGIKINGGSIQPEDQIKVPLPVDEKYLTNGESQTNNDISKGSLFGYAGYSKTTSQSVEISISEQKQQFQALAISSENIYIESVNSESFTPVFDELVQQKLKPMDILIVTNIDMYRNSLSSFLKKQNELFQEKSIVLISLDFPYSEHKSICELIHKNGFDKFRQPFDKFYASNTIKNKKWIDRNLFQLFLNNAGNSAERQKEIRRSQLRITYTILYYCSLRISEIRHYTKENVEDSIKFKENDYKHKHYRPTDEIIKDLENDSEMIFKTFNYQYLFGKNKPITDKNLIKIVNDDLKNTCSKYHIKGNITSLDFIFSIPDDISRFLQKENTRIIPDENYICGLSSVFLVYYNAETNQMVIFDKDKKQNYSLFKVSKLEIDSINSDEIVYDRERHSELLQLRESNDILTSTQELDLEKYFSMLNGRMYWETKEAYLELFKAFVEEKLDFNTFFNSFEKRNILTKAIVKDITIGFKNKSFVLLPDQKSNEFSDYITQIEIKTKILKSMYSDQNLFMSDALKSQSYLSIDNFIQHLKELLTEFIEKYAD